MRNSLWALILAVLVGGCATTGEKLLFSPSVEKVLLNLSHNYQVESVVCLQYNRTWMGNIYVTDYYFPVTYQSTRTGVTYSRCPERYNMKWHNHPAINTLNPAIMAWVQSKTDKEINSKRHLVYMSGIDIDSANKGHHKIVVVSTGNYFAWWYAGQVKESEGEDILFPIDGQMVKL